MLDLLITILIALGCNVQPGSSEADIQATYSVEYQRAIEISESGNYRLTDGGGVVIVEIGGD
ncbi:MAG: hypothetical protein IPP71_11245 [Bacteroidetes bacterium]|nr:hypothetical protein [Bacteroidota bacterium]